MQSNHTKTPRGQEIAMYKLLNTITPKYNTVFKILQFPYPVKFIEYNKISMPDYNGRKYNNIWGKNGGGGILMGKELAREVPLMIHDLANINIEEIRESPFIKDIPHIEFNSNSDGGVDWISYVVHQRTGFANQ